MRIRFIITIIVFFLISSESCRKKINTRAQLINYINNPNNGLQKIDQVGNIKIELTFRPWQLLLPKRSNKKLSNEIIKKFQSNYYFVMSLSENNKELLKMLPFDDYSNLVQTFAFKMPDYISANGDSKQCIHPENCFFEETFGNSFSNQILVQFNSKELEKFDKLNIEIKEFGLNTGNIYFTFNTSTLKDVSILRINDL